MEQSQIEVGDRVEVVGDTQHFILKDPNRVYTGEVTGKYEGQLLVRLDETIGQGPGAFREVSVQESNARLTHSRNK
jgi:hypothetical protein